MDECFAHDAAFSNPAMNRRTLLTTLTTLPVVFASAQIFAAVKRWRVCVIGHTGRGDYGHGLDAMWLRIPETEIVAVADADEKGLEGAKKKLSVSTGFADYRQRLAESKLDIVAVGPRH